MTKHITVTFTDGTVKQADVPDDTTQQELIDSLAKNFPDKQIKQVDGWNTPPNTTTPPTPQRNRLYNANVDALQKELLKINPKGLPVHKNDGVWGPETSGLSFSTPETTEIAKKYADKIPQLKGILDAKQQAQEIGNRANPSNLVTPVIPTVDLTQNNQTGNAAQVVPPTDAAAVADIKKIASTPLNNIPRFGIAIDPKTGQIYYGDAGGETNQPQPKGYPFKWMQPGGPGESIRDGERIKAAGLEIVDKGGFAYVDPAQLQQVISGGAPTPPANASSGTGFKFTPNPNSTNPLAKESVGYGEDSILARIVELARR